MGFFIMSKEEMIAKFKLWYPQLASKPENIIDMAYELASNRVKANIWTNLYEEGFLALMAHTVYMRTLPENQQGTVNLQATSKTVGKLSVGYTDTNATKYATAGEYALSSYGRAYFDLRAMVSPTGRVI